MRPDEEVIYDATLRQLRRLAETDEKQVGDVTLRRLLRLALTACDICNSELERREGV